MTAVEGSTALVTCGSRGIGRGLIEAPCERGTRTEYGPTRHPGTVTHPDAVPPAPEVTDPAALGPQLTAV
jgi:hypothetical protein